MGRLHGSRPVYDVELVRVVKYVNSENGWEEVEDRLRAGWV